MESADQLIKLQPQSVASWWFHSFVLSAIKDHKRALKSIDYARKIDPKAIAIWQLRGNILVDLKRYHEALSSYNKAIALEASGFDLFLGKSAVLLKLKRYEDAMASCDQALKLNADDWRILSIRAEAAYHLEKYIEAVDDCNKVIQQDEYNCDIWYNKGAALVQLKRYEEALICYDKALVLSPEDIKSWRVRSRVLIELGRYEEAIESFGKVVEQTDDKAKAWADYASYIVVKEGKGTKFSKRYSRMVILISEKAIEIDQNCFSAHLFLSFSKRAMGEFSDALKAIDTAIKLKNEFKELYSIKARVLFDLKQYEKALEALEQAKPDKEYWIVKASCFQLLDRHSEALKCYKSAMRLDKNDVDLYVQCAIAAIQLNDDKTAIVYVNQAIRLKPSCAQAWFLHGGLNAMLGKSKKQVLADFAKAVHFNPNKSKALLGSSRALFSMNYNDEAMLECRKALKIFDEVIQTNATDASAFYNRACCYALLGEANAALTDLSQAIRLNPAYAGQAAEHSDFASLAANADFQLLTHSDETNATVAKEKSPVKKQGLLAYQDNGADLLANYLPSMDLTLGALQTKTAANPFTLSASQNWR